MKKLRMLILGFSILLVECSTVSFAKEPERMIQIPQSEFTLLKSQLKNANKEIEWQQKTLKNLGEKKLKLEEEVKKSKSQLWKGFKIGVGVTIGVGGLGALIYYLSK